MTSLPYQGLCDQGQGSLALYSHQLGSMHPCTYATIWPFMCIPSICIHDGRWIMNLCTHAHVHYPHPPNSHTMLPPQLHAHPFTLVPPIFPCLFPLYFGRDLRFDMCSLWKASWTCMYLLWTPTTTLSIVYKLYCCRIEHLK